MSLVVLLNLLVKPLWLLIEMEVQDVVGHADWGMYAALLSFGFLFITLSDLGINQYATKTLASEPGLMRSFFPNLLSFKALLAILYPLSIALIGLLIGYRGEQIIFLMLLCLVHAGGQFANFFRANFQAMQRFRIDGFLSVFDRIALLILTAILFYLGINIERFIYARVLAVGMTILVFYGLILRFYGWLRPRLDWTLIRKIVRSSLPLALMTILYSVHDKVDQVMLERIAGEEENGLYAGAYRWLEAFSMYMWTVLPIFFARFAFKKGKVVEQEKLLHAGQVITSIPLSFVSIFVWFYGEKLLFLFDQSSPEQILVMTSCLKAVFVAVWLNGHFAIFSTLMTSTGLEKNVNIFAIVSILLNIVLNYIFIPEYGAVASAWTTAVSYLVLSLSYILFFQLRLEIRVPYWQMAKLFLLSGIVWMSFYLLGESGLEWWLVSAIAGGILLIGSIGLGLVSRKLIKDVNI